EVSGFEPGTSATIEVYKLYREAPGEAVQRLTAAVQGAQIKAKWKYQYKKEDEGKRPQFVFRVKVGEQWTVSSNVLEISESVEIELVGEDNQPIAGERYRVTSPDAVLMFEGTLDEKGFARVERVGLGTCKITFPNLDKEAWEQI